MTDKSQSAIDNDHARDLAEGRLLCLLSAWPGEWPAMLERVSQRLVATEISQRSTEVASCRTSAK